MLSQFLLNLLIAVLWVLFQDEDTLTIPTFASGYLVGLVVIFIMHRFFGLPFYLKRVVSIGKLLMIFNYELITSSAMIMKQILLPGKKFVPGLFEYETKLKNDWEITALALLLMLTPGSVVLRVSPEGNVFQIHAMDIKDAKKSLVRSIRLYEKTILEVTGRG